MISRLLCAVIFLLSLSSLAQTNSPKVSEIKRNPARWQNEQVRLEGFVTQFTEDTARSTKFYYLKDDWGGIIKVRTTGDSPNVGRRHVVVGPISIDPRFGNKGEPFVSEESRVEIGSGSDTTAANVGSQAAPAPSPSSPSPAKEDDGAMPIGYYIAAGTVFVLIAAVVLYIIRTRHNDEPELISSALPEPEPKPAEHIEGRTIKLQVPPPGTLKLLPGKLEVISGDDTVKEVRFYKPRGRNVAEITFGRAKGPAYSHIQLKPMTVSSRQAKMIFDAEKVYLVNYPSTDSNPTKINGREMVVEESVPLQPDDQITMGEIEFRYRPN